MKDFDRILTVTDAKKNLPDLVKRVQEYGESTAITRNGYPAAVLLSLEEYEGLIETLEILGDAATLKAIRKSLAELERGKTVTEKELWGE